MYTIKQAARLTGVPEASLRAWERRYGVVTPRRTESGYRIYDDASVATVSAMRQLVQAGWSPAEAARRLRPGATPEPSPRAGPDAAGENAATHMELFLSSAALMDTEGIEESLDRGFALGSFEHVVDFWLFPTLEALGEGWMRGEVDVAGEHAASAAVHRRLSAAYQAAGSRTRGASVVVGLPPGSRHELGALAFATTLRRRGMDVLYLGADVPGPSWDKAVRTRSARAAVLAVVTADDRPSAAAVVDRLKAGHPDLVVASGGACGHRLGAGVHTLGPTLGVAAQELDALLHAPTGG
ncbi:MAG TPA: MerR family transcriptional regulator [Nocardioidaceae bacterium]|nr:MerR family transcriptional regulator [Nocardioidaceae bacterium]